MNGAVEVVRSGPLPYLLLRPEHTTEPLPLLCFLHGYDEAAPLDIRDGVTRHGPLRPGSAAADRFLIVAPQLPRAGDLWHRYGAEVRALVEEAHEAHGGDAHRRYLTGFSFGGNGVFDLALREPGFWAALWPVDPTRVPAQDPGCPVWLSSGEVSRRREAGYRGVLGLTPVSAGGAGERVLEDRGLDHVGTATAAYRDARIYGWLLQWSLGAGGGGL